MTRLVLVRHGEAQSYLDQVVGGQKGCSGLSEYGRQQARLLRERLARTAELGEVAALYASILPRAVETAKIINPALGDLPMTEDCDLCELHPGEADGLPWEEYREQYAFEGWDPEREMSPGGESWVSFVRRVGDALNRLVQAHPDDTVVVACHGGVVMGSFVAGFNLSPVGHKFDTPENTSLTEWLVDDGHWQLVRYNDAAHLTLG